MAAQSTTTSAPHPPVTLPDGLNRVGLPVIHRFRAEFPSFGEAVARADHDHAARPQREGALKREESHRSGPQHDHGFARMDTGPLDGMEPDGRGIDVGGDFEGHVVGYLVDALQGIDHELGVGPVCDVAVLAVAQFGMTIVHAEVVRPMRHIRQYPQPLWEVPQTWSPRFNPEACRPCAQRDDAPRPFMAEGHRKVFGPLLVTALDDGDVGAADGHRLHPAEDFAKAGPGCANLLHAEILHPMETDGFHGLGEWFQRSSVSSPVE